MLLLVISLHVCDRDGGQLVVVIFCYARGTSTVCACCHQLMTSGVATTMSPVTGSEYPAASKL